MATAALRFSSVRVIDTEITPDRRTRPLAEPRIVLNLVAETKAGTLRTVDLTEDQALALIEQTTQALIRIRRNRP